MAKLLIFQILSKFLVCQLCGKFQIWWKIVISGNTKVSEFFSCFRSSRNKNLRIRDPRVEVLENVFYFHNWSNELLWKTQVFFGFGMHEILIQAWKIYDMVNDYIIVLEFSCFTATIFLQIPNNWAFFCTCHNNMFTCWIIA